MLVHCIDKVRILLLSLTIKIPGQIIKAVFHHRACSSEKLHLRIYFMHCFFKANMTVKNIRVPRFPLLVSDRKHFKTERLRVSHLCTKSAPFTVCRAICKFDQIQRILNKCFKFFALNRNHLCRTELTRHSHRKHRKGFGAKELTQQKIFVETNSVGLSIMSIRTFRIQFLSQASVIYKSPEIWNIFSVF